MARQLKVTLVRSTIGKVPKHQKTVKALGLKRPNQSVTVNDSPQVRGMIKSIEYMVQVSEVE